jgi:hypothetical protein
MNYAQIPQQSSLPPSSQFITLLYSVLEFGTYRNLFNCQMCGPFFIIGNDKFIERCMNLFDLYFYEIITLPTSAENQCLQQKTLLWRHDTKMLNLLREHLNYRDEAIRQAWCMNKKLNMNFYATVYFVLTCFLSSNQASSVLSLST